MEIPLVKETNYFNQHKVHYIPTMCGTLLNIEDDESIRHALDFQGTQNLVEDENKPLSFSLR